MKRASVFSVLVFLLLAVAMLAVNFAETFAQEDGERRKQRFVEIVKGKDYDISIGNAGLFLEDARMEGELRMTVLQWTNRGWQQFTQRVVDFRVVDESGRHLDTVFGFVRVYFELSLVERRLWEEDTSNMSIWVRNEAVGGWTKCRTRLEDSPQHPQGRLSCLIDQFGVYGLAYTSPTLKMKLEKANQATATPTLTPTP